MGNSRQLFYELFDKYPVWEAIWAFLNGADLVNFLVAVYNKRKEVNIEIMNRGMHYLLEKLGVAETERFIAVINRERFDYTKWQRERFDNMSSDEFSNAAVAYSKENPFCKKSEAVTE